MSPFPDETNEAARTIGTLIAQEAARSPDRVALLAPDRQPLTYARLGEVVVGVGAQLRAAGISAGDRVALVTANGPQAVTAFLAIAAVATVAPLNPAYRREELEFDLTDLRIRAVVVEVALDTPAAEVAQALGIPVFELTHEDAPAGTIRLRPRDPGSDRFPITLDVAAGADPTDKIDGPSADDIALVLHTSGTTARPKIVPLTHGRLVASARTISAALELTEADRCLNVMPLFHIHGLVAAVLATIASGGSIVATPGFVAPSFFGWLDAFEPTWYTAVPTIHQGVLARSARHTDPSPGVRLRFIRSSSASLPLAVLEELEARFGVPVVEAYGMTEASHQMASNPLPPAARKPGSVGRATGIEITILDPEGRPAAPGSIGEVAIRGATVFDGYEANPEANAAAFVDGWFRTGDEGTLDADGYLSLHGRLKELINRGGEKVAPVEVEEALLSIPGVAQAVVFAMPDPRLGEAVAAAVVEAEGARLTERDLQARVAERLADFKVPRAIRVVPEIPKGPTGKIQRIGMAKRLGLDDSNGSGARRPGGGASAGTGGDRSRDVVGPRTELEATLVAIWSEVLGVDPVGITDDFFELGGDSVLAAMIITRIGNRFRHRDLPLATFLWAPTIERYAEGLDAGAWQAASSPLLPIQPEGSRPPFFFVHIDDRIMSLATLRGFLDPDQPLYGLRAVGLDGGELPPSIDGLAGTFLELVRTVQPVGPYHLGGFCSGGRVAIEMARRLERDAEPVGLLALVDPRVDRPHDLSYYIRRARLHRRNGRFLRKLGGFIGWIWHKNARTVRGQPPSDDPYGDRLARTPRTQPPEPYGGDVVIFSSLDYDVPRDLWNGVARHVTFETLPVAHETIFHGDECAIFAAHLSDTLRAATGDA